MPGVLEHCPGKVAPNQDLRWRFGRPDSVVLACWGNLCSTFLGNLKPAWAEGFLGKRGGEGQRTSAPTCAKHPPPHPGTAGLWEKRRSEGHAPLLCNRPRHPGCRGWSSEAPRKDRAPAPLPCQQGQTAKRNKLGKSWEPYRAGRSSSRCRSQGPRRRSGLPSRSPVPAGPGPGPGGRARSPPPRTARWVTLGEPPDLSGPQFPGLCSRRCCDRVGELPRRAGLAGGARQAVGAQDALAEDRGARRAAPRGGAPRRRAGAGGGGAGAGRGPSAQARRAGRGRWGRALRRAAQSARGAVRRAGRGRAGRWLAGLARDRLRLAPRAARRLACAGPRPPLLSPVRARRDRVRAAAAASAGHWAATPKGPGLRGRCAPRAAAAAGPPSGVGSGAPRPRRPARVPRSWGAGGVGACGAAAAARPRRVRVPGPGGRRAWRRSTCRS